MPKYKSYHTWLTERLKDHDKALAYLNVALEDSQSGTPEIKHAFLIALKNVAAAHGGLSEIAQKAHLSRESLYKALSPSGNPKWSSILALADALGIKFNLSPSNDLSTTLLPKKATAPKRPLKAKKKLLLEKKHKA